MSDLIYNLRYSQFEDLRWFSLWYEGRRLALSCWRWQVRTALDGLIYRAVTGRLQDWCLRLASARVRRNLLAAVSPQTRAIMLANWRDHGSLRPRADVRHWAWRLYAVICKLTDRACNRYTDFLVAAYMETHDL